MYCIYCYVILLVLFVDTMRDAIMRCGDHHGIGIEISVYIDHDLALIKLA